MAYLWIEGYGNALDITRRILIVDADLGWRQRSNLDTTFLKLPLQTNELGWRAPPLEDLLLADRPILVLGPSSTFGWGVRADETYAARLEALLHESRTRVINAGEIGYTTDQGVRLYRQILGRGLRPRCVVIAYGINDIDRHRFYFQSERSDAEEFSAYHSPVTLQIQRAASLTSTTIVALKLAGYLRREIFLDHLKSPGPVVPPLRVSPDEFERNLRRLILMARTQEARVVLLTSVYHLPATPRRNAAAVAAAAELLSQGERHYSARDFVEAGRLFEMSTALAPDQNEAWYYRAVLAFEAGNRSEAKQMFNLALNSEPARVQRDVDRYNDIVRRVASLEEVELGDTTSWFDSSDPATLFVDPIHPSVEGHGRIAKELKTLLARGEGHDQD